MESSTGQPAQTSTSPEPLPGTAGGTDSPIHRLAGGLVAALAITAGNEHTRALLGNGTARRWGHNDLGQLGLTGSRPARRSTSLI